MKTKLIIGFALLLGMVNMAVAQEKKNDNKAKKIAFITERLELTSEESKAFWPLFEERSKAQKELRKSLKVKKKGEPKKKIDEMTDTEVIALLDRVIAMRQGNLDIHKMYNTKFLAVLTPKKVAKFYHIEKEFKKQRKAEKKQ